MRSAMLKRETSLPSSSDVSAFHRHASGDRLEQFGASGAHQPVDADDFAARARPARDGRRAACWDWPDRPP